MTTNPNRLADLSDQELLSEVTSLAHREREATARLIASLAELDARRLYLGEGCSSLFTYCTQVLRLSEHAAYGRIEAARAARRFPAILALLTKGSVTLTAIGLIAAHLTADNHETLLAAVCHKSKREVENLVAAIRPQPAVPSSIRKLPQPVTKPAPVATPPSTIVVGSSEDADQNTPAPAPRLPVTSSRQAVVTPLAPERYRIQLTVARETHYKLRQVQDLLRHTVPNGDPAAIFDQGVDAAARGPAADETRRDGPATRRAADGFTFAPHPGCREAGGLDARWRPVRVRRHERPLH